MRYQTNTMAKKGPWLSFIGKCGPDTPDQFTAAFSNTWPLNKDISHHRQNGAPNLFLGTGVLLRDFRKLGRYNL